MIYSDEDFKAFVADRCEMVSQWVEASRHALKDKVEDIVPVFHIKGRDDERQWTALDMPPTADERLRWVFHHAAHQTHDVEYIPFAFALAVVCWIVVQEEGKETKLMPSDHPERREIFLLICGTLDGKKQMLSAPLHRKFGFVYGVGKFEEWEAEEIGMLNAFRAGIAAGVIARRAK